jgi:hypothetical protein
MPDSHERGFQIRHWECIIKNVLKNFLSAPLYYPKRFMITYDPINLTTPGFYWVVAEALPGNVTEWSPTRRSLAEMKRSGGVR